MTKSSQIWSRLVENYFFCNVGQHRAGLAVHGQCAIIAVMREMLLFVLSGFAFLFILGYSVHMFVGGLVAPEVERSLIAAAVVIGAIAFIWLLRDAQRKRKAR